jgi:hypothetical protein
MLKGSFEIAFQEICRRQKVTGVGIIGIEAQGALQASPGFGEFVPAIGNSGQLQKKFFVVGIFPATRLQSGLRFVPALQLSQCQPPIQVELGGLVGGRRRRLNNLGPTLLGIKPLYSCDGISVGERFLRECPRRETKIEQ